MKKNTPSATPPSNEKLLRFGIRKFKFGAASVAVAATIFLGASPVAQAQEQEAPALEVENPTGDSLAEQDSAPILEEVLPLSKASSQPEPVALVVVEEVVDNTNTSAPEAEVVSVSAQPSPEEAQKTEETTEPVAEAPKAADLPKDQQVAPSLTTTDKDVYVFANTPFEKEVVTVDSATPVLTTRFVQADGTRDLALDGVVATEAGALSGTIADPGIYRRQISFETAHGAAVSETINVHALDVAFRQLTKIINQPLTPEEVLGALVIKRGNDTTLSDEQIGKRVVTQLEDFPEKTGTVQVEVTLPDGTSKIFDLSPQVTSGTTAFHSTGRTGFRSATTGINPPTVTDIPTNVYSFFGQNIRIPMTINSATPIERTKMVFAGINGETEQAIPGITLGTDGVLSGVFPEVAGIYTREFLFDNATGRFRSDRVNLHVLNVTTNEVPVEYGVPVTEEDIRNAVNVDKGRNPLINDNDIIKSVIIPDGGLPTYGTSTVSVVVELPDGSTKVVPVTVDFTPIGDKFDAQGGQTTYPDTNTAEQAATAIRDAVTVDPAAGNVTKVIQGNVPRQQGRYNIPVKVVYPDLSEEIVEVAVTVTPNAAQEAARRAIEEAATAKTNQIDNNNNLTAEEKEAAKAQVNAERTKSLDAVNAATDSQAIETAKTSGTTALDRVNPAPIAKSTAVAAVNDAAVAKKATIDSNPDLTAEEKTAAKAQVDEEATKAVAAVNAATTNAQVTAAKDAATSALANQTTTPVVKPEALAAIDQAAATKKAAIDNDSTLTVEEKAAAKAQVDSAADQARQAIRTGADNAAVAGAQASGEAAIAAVQTTSAKPAAIDAINDAAREKRLALNSNRELTREERAERRAEIERERQAAVAAVEAATTEAAIASAQEQGVNTLKAVDLTSPSKTDARQTISDLVAAKKAEIDALPGLSEEDKAVSKALVDNEANKILDALSKSTTNAEVAIAKRKAQNVIPEVQPRVSSSLDSAILDQVADAKKAEIDANPALTTEEKAAAKAQVDEQRAQAESAIRAATDKAAAQAILDAAQQSIESYAPTPVAKPAAIDAINEAAREKRLALNSSRDLTREEKTALRAEIERERQEALAAVEAATSTAAVDAARTQGVTDVSAISVDSVVKADARRTVAELSEAKKAEIDANSSLTTEEKEAAKATVDREANKILDAIAKSASNAEVAISKKKATDVLPAINPQSSVKPTAQAELAQAVADKKAAILGAPGLTDDEKQAALAQVDAEASRLAAAIAASGSAADTNQVKTQALNTIAAINPTAQVKPAALAAINQAADDRLKAIEATADATADEKRVAKEQVERERATALANITSATTDAVVDKAKETGVTAIAAVKPEAQTRSSVLADLDRVTAAKLAEIASNNELTEEEKTQARSSVEAERKKATAAINQATTVAELTTAINQGTSTITALTPTPQAKPAALAAVQQAADAKIASIEDNPELTNQEKQVAIEQIEAERRRAQEAIAAGSTTAAVQAAAQAGQQAISGINPTSQVKPAAVAALNQAADAKLAEIDANINLTDEEKAAAKANVEAERRQAIAALDTAVSDEAIRSIVANSQAAQASLSPIAVAKGKALADLIQAILDKEAAINSNSELTLEEKDAALLTVLEEARVAERAIIGATTNASVAVAAESGVQAIQSINPVAVAKPETRASINRVADARLVDIDTNYPLATSDEKRIAKEQVNRERDIALGIIDTLQTTKAIEAERVALETSIAVVQPQAQAKLEAIADVNEVTDAKLAFIDSNDVLTAEEKAAAREQAEISRLETIAKIEAAETDEAVTALKNDGVSGISQINPEPVVKQGAIDALTAIVNGRLAELEADTELTAEERLVAERQLREELATAITAILSAETQDGVTGAQASGQVAVEAVEAIAEIKPKAITEINDIANAKLATIDGNNNLTVEEREVYRQQIEAERQEALEKINQATNNNDVASQKEVETEAIRQVTPESTVKSLALAAIEEAVAAKRAALQLDSQLTAEEKAAFEAELTSQRAVSIREITRATSLDGIANLRQAALTAIQNLVAVGQIKATALEAIDAMAAARAASIDAREDLTAAEKATAKAEIEAERLQARRAIETADSNEAVNVARSSGASRIALIDPSPASKPIPDERPVPTPEPAPQPEPVPTPEPAPQPEPVPTPEPAPQPEPVPTPEPAPQPEPVPTPEPAPQPEPVPTPEPAPQPEPVPTPEPAPQPEPVPTPEPAPQPEPVPTPEPAPQPEPVPTPEPAPQPEPVPTPEPAPQPEPVPTPEPAPQPEPVPTPEPAPQPEPVPTPEPAPQPEPVPTPEPAPQPEPVPTKVSTSAVKPTVTTTSEADEQPTSSVVETSSSEQVLPHTGERSSLVGLQFLVWSAALALLYGRVAKKQD